MDRTNTIPYRYCIVPLCTNTTKTTPNKYFFHVPNDKNMRNKWCQLMKREERLSTKTSRHCCEDHFDIEADTENLVKWRLVGGTLKLKQGIVPTKFACQKRQKSPVTRPAYDKRRRIEYYEQILGPAIQPSLAQQPIEFISCPNDVMEEEYEATNQILIDNTLDICIEKKTTRNKGVQTEQKNKTVETQTVVKKQEKLVSLSPNKSFDTSFSSDTYDDLEISSSCSESIKTCNRFIDSRKNTISKIQNDPKLYLGIPKESYFVISLLTKNTKCPLINILITLKKIKLNDCYNRLSIDFNIKNISRIFRKTVPLLANCLKELILFPSKEAVAENLPIPFRKRYYDIQSIIDCFEIRIEKPSNSLHQALTWSQYKTCNTIKYLISITPDGLINFVSDGYGGRVTDTDIFRDCKILEKIPKGGAILADRGFKNIAPEVEKYGCNLVRPPSVSTGTKISKKEVMETKRIAALRIHVERSISRIREFKMTSPHACIDTKVIDMLDSIVIITCGLINLQSKLV